MGPGACTARPSTHSDLAQIRPGDTAPYRGRCAITPARTKRNRWCAEPLRLVRGTA